MQSVIVRLEKVGVTYQNKLVALESVCLQLNRGEFAVVLGASGAGKTTLLRTINHLTPPTQGRILVNGLGELSTPERLAIASQTDWHDFSAASVNRTLFSPGKCADGPISLSFILAKPIAAAPGRSKNRPTVFRAGQLDGESVNPGKKSQRRPKAASGNRPRPGATAPINVGG